MVNGLIFLLYMLVIQLFLITLVAIGLFIALIVVNRKLDKKIF